MPTTDWKLQIDDLRALAAQVVNSPIDRCLSASGAARCFMGVLRHVAEGYGTSGMQHACALLARHQPAWTTKMRDLPRDPTSGFRFCGNVALIAMVARGILEAAGPDNTRAALAYWASEDPSAIVQERATA